MVPCLPRHTVAAVVAISLQPTEYVHHVVRTGHLEGRVPHILPIDRKRAPLVGIGRLDPDADALVPEGGWVGVWGGGEADCIREVNRKMQRRVER